MARQSNRPRARARKLARAPMPANSMQFISLDECRDRLCSGPVKVDRDAFVKALLNCSNRERREVADLLLAEKFGELS